MNPQFYGTNRHVVFVRGRGRITIPAPVRERYGLEAGSALILAEEEDRLVLFVSQEKYVESILDGIGSALKEQGLTPGDVLEEDEETGAQPVEESSRQLADEHEL